MEKKITWVLSWTCNGNRHTREYDSDHIAQICYDECKSIKANKNIKLVKVTAEVVSTTEQPRKKLRAFAVIQFRKDSNLEPKYYELANPTQISRFSQCLIDRDVFTVSFYVSEDVPNFIRRAGWIQMK